MPKHPFANASRTALAVRLRLYTGLRNISRARCRRRAGARKADALLLLLVAGCAAISAFTKSETVSVIALVVILVLATPEHQDGAILKVIYQGDPIRLDQSKIKTDMRVPARCGADGPADTEGGAVAATLFRDALAAGAIIAPKQLRLECYADEDEFGAGVILIAFPDTAGAATGLTCGWRDVENITAEEHQDPFDPALVIDALEFYVAELNTACQLGRIS
jgi:hypothetical protein